MAFIHKRCIGTIARAWSDMVPTQYSDSFDAMFAYTQAKLCGKSEYIYKIPSIPAMGGSSFHETMRNGLVAGMEGDWLFMSDTDHQFAPDALVRLFHYKHLHNAPVISGLYLTKMEPHVPVARLWGSNDMPVQVIGWDEGDTVVDVGMVGGGALLVDRWVFDLIKHKMSQEPFDQAIINGVRFSEDFSFCWRCREVGLPVKLAVSVEFHHLGQRGLVHSADHVQLRKKNDDK